MFSFFPFWRNSITDGIIGHQRNPIIRWLGRRLNAPASATSKGWTTWKEKCKSKPIAYFFYETLPDFWQDHINSPIDKALWWYKYRFVKKHQYHIIRPQVEPGWHDADYMIVHSMFKILCSFVQDEEGIQTVTQRANFMPSQQYLDLDKDQKRYHQDNWNVEVQKDYKKILDAYNWHRFGRKAVQAEKEKIQDDRVKNSDEHGHALDLSDMTTQHRIEFDYYSDKIQILEEKIKDEDTRHLHNIIDVRGKLWT